MGAEEVNRRVVVIARPDMPETDEFVALFDNEATIDVDVIITETPGEIETAVARAIEDGADSIASVGGDGSMNLVVGAMIRQGADIAVAPVRAGTVNLATKVFGLDDAQGTADAIIARRSRVIDVGETDQGVFVLNASIGFDAAVIEDADDHSDARFGQLRFLQAGLRRLRRESGDQVRVEVDGVVEFDARAMSVVVLNVGQRASESLYVAPDAEPDDGVLDVVIVRVDTVRRMVATVWRLIRRRDVPARDAVRAQGARITIAWAHEAVVQRDGDTDDPVRRSTVTCRAGALRIHCGSSQSPTASSRRARTN